MARVSSWCAVFTATVLAAFAAAPVAGAQAGKWPREGRIVYRVLYGEGGPQLGEARHAWSHDGARYRMETVVETTGVAAMLYNFHYVQRSEGRVLASGLRPERFVVDRRGRKLEMAEFDWNALQVSIHRKSRVRTAELHPGDQDVLSLSHQIGAVAGGPRADKLTVVTSKVAEPSTVEVVGRERVRLPVGTVDAVRLKARADDGSLALDIWLDAERHFLPVRVLMKDDKGEVLDQQALSVELGDAAGVGSAGSR